MADIKKILKDNKKRALTIAVAAAFTVTVPIHMIGCADKTVNKKDEQDKDTVSTTTGSGSSYHRNYFRTSRFSTSSYSKNSSDTSDTSTSSDGDSGSTSNKSGKSKVTSSKSSGYSGVKGGHVSS